MVEALIVEWLNTESALVNDGFEAFMDVPETRPARFITVERTGGPEGLITGSPMLAVQVWAKYRFEAASFATRLAVELQKLVLLPWVARVQVSSVYNFPDPDSGQARYQITVELVTKFD